MSFALPNDPYICVSLLNMKLRDQYPSLADLCEDLDINLEKLIANLKDHSFYYDPQTNQFKEL